MRLTLRGCEGMQPLNWLLTHIWRKPSAAASESLVVAGRAP